MKVTGIETYLLSAPLPKPVRTSTHVISRVSEVIVALTTDAGLVGIGEAHGPFLFQQGPDGLRSVRDILAAITPLVVGQDPFDVERIWQDMFALTYTSVRGIPALARQQRPLVTAISAIDIALWDLKGKAIGRPVYALLGGALRQRVPAYVTGFYYRDGERPDDLAREAAAYLELGYRTLKVKVGGLTPEADAERVCRIRQAVGADIALMLDANQGWNLPTAVRAARLCAPHDIFWLEDPMPWYDERHTLQRLKAEVGIPIAAGETEISPFGLRTMLAEALVDYLIIDSTWAGGLTTWRKAAVMAELYQVPLAAHRLHPGVVRRPRARPALVRAVPGASGDRRRVHGAARGTRARARAAPGDPREVRRPARLRAAQRRRPDHHPDAPRREAALRCPAPPA